LPGRSTPDLTYEAGASFAVEPVVGSVAILIFRETVEGNFRPKSITALAITGSPIARIASATIRPASYLRISRGGSRMCSVTQNLGRCDIIAKIPMMSVAFQPYGSSPSDLPS
jgi:hypothetical protein